MTLIAVFRAYDDLAFMTLGNAVRTLQYEADQQLVLFDDREMMTVMAVECLVLALRPAVVGRLHQVTTDAELGIVLSKIIKFKSNKPAAEHNDEEKRYDQYLCF